MDTIKELRAKTAPAAEEPVVAASEPVEAAPEPVEAAPEPVVAAPEPVVAAPEPVVAAPEPVVAAPAPPAPKMTGEYSVGDDVKIIQSVPNNKPPSAEDTIEGRYAGVLFTTASQ